jgi:hypothetical protein
VSSPSPSTRSVPALTFTVPVLLNRPIQPPEVTCSDCTPPAFLFTVPRLLNSGNTPPSDATGDTLLVFRLIVPAAALTSVGTWLEGLV